MNIGACFLLCIYGFLATSSYNITTNVKYFALFQTLMLQLYQFCHMGQHLMEVTEDIGLEFTIQADTRTRTKTFGMRCG